MAEIEEYGSLQDALTTLRPDQEYTIVRHVLKRGETVGEHFHPAANEIIIARGGGFYVLSDLSRLYIGNKWITALTFPNGALHGIEAERDISYFVVRDAPDETVWLSDLLKTRESLSPIENEGETIWELYNEGNLSIAYVRVNGTVREHWHAKMHEIYRAEAGQGEVVVNGKPVKIAQGGVLSLPPQTRHNLKKARGRLEILALAHPAYDPSDVFYT